MNDSMAENCNVKIQVFIKFIYKKKCAMVYLPCDYLNYSEHNTFLKFFKMIQKFEYLKSKEFYGQKNDLIFIDPVHS